MAKLKVEATFSNPKVVAVDVVEIGWRKRTKHPHPVSRTKATRPSPKDPWTATVTTKAPKPGRKNTLQIVGLDMNGAYIACVSIPVRSKKWP